MLHHETIQRSKHRVRVQNQIILRYQRRIRYKQFIERNRKFAYATKRIACDKFENRHVQKHQFVLFEKGNNCLIFHYVQYCRLLIILLVFQCLSSITHHLHACVPKVKEELFEKIINGVNKIFNTD